MLLCLFGAANVILSQSKRVKIKLFQTTDMHGSFFPFDLAQKSQGKSSFAQVSTYVKAARKQHGDNLLLLDGGDALQGQPSVYYYNFIDTTSTHLCAEIMNYLRYDAAVMGNHDIEPGRSVYERWIAQCNHPVLGGNILQEDGTPYLPPYQIFEKEGVKIAVVGMITEAVPAWLPQNLWEGLSFANIQESCSLLIPRLREEENPDVIVGLFHTGVKPADTGGISENVGMEVARSIPGFDVVFCGHDHRLFCDTVVNVEGNPVWVLNSGAGADWISNVTLDIKRKKGAVTKKKITGQLDRISNLKSDVDYMNRFGDDCSMLIDYVNEEIGEFSETIHAKDAFLGSSAFIDMLHELQLELTGADVSLVAPFSATAVIDSGKVYVRDMFNLYKYENLLYTMSFTGKEIRNALEYSYGLWCHQMSSEEDPFLILTPNENGSYSFTNPYFSYDSAAGICYTVDLTQPVGSRITITSMADGAPFGEDKLYRVAVSSYQGSGGGGILTTGIGIDEEELDRRFISSTDKDLRFYLTEKIRREKVVHPKPLNNWRFIQEEWVKKAADREIQLLLGK